VALYGDVISRLSSFGYTIKENQQSAVTYSINRATEYIKANINREKIPDELYYTHVDMAVGLFLRDMKSTGQLGESFDFAASVKSISEGDVSITYADTGTPEEKFDSMVNSMTNPPQSTFSAFRRLKW